MKQILALSLVLLIALTSFAEDSSPSTQPKQEKISEPESGKIQVPRKKYIVGGILGSAIGLGIGHMVEDRYLVKGLVFTTTEVAGLLLISSAHCSGHRNTDRDTNGRGDCDDASRALLGIGLWAGFHTWEIIDLWVGAMPVSKPNEVAAMILPSKDGPMLSLSMGF